MSHREFNHILTSIDGLSPEQMEQLARELQSKIAASRRSTMPFGADETAFDAAERAGLIGCIEGAPRSPTDLSTNPKHMEGFGRE
ncbi:MAG: hypothetical protein P4L84_29980 [Isosphaeraceae bacterium]|nr:hypothetical protein [Isosphaeraceae bacterium]